MRCGRKGTWSRRPRLTPRRTGSVSGYELRLHPARHHAARRQWAATARADQGAAPQGERDHRVGSRLARGQGTAVGPVARTTILPKPFHTAELLARVKRSVLRRSRSGGDMTALVSGNVSLWPRGSARLGGRPRTFFAEKGVRYPFLFHAATRTIWSTRRCWPKPYGAITPIEADNFHFRVRPGEESSSQARRSRSDPSRSRPFTGSAISSRCRNPNNPQWVRIAPASEYAPPHETDLSHRAPPFARSAAAAGPLGRAVLLQRWSTKSTTRPTTPWKTIRS